MYHILESQSHIMKGRITYLNSGFGRHFTQGKVIDQSFSDGKIFVEFESNHENIPDYFELAATPIVSDRFASFLKQTPIDNYQLFPVVIKMPDSQVIDYFIVNVVGRVSCIDVDASDTKKYEHRIMRMNNLVLRSDFDEELDLFRCYEYPLVIFISDRINDLLSSSNLVGMKINPADGWSDKHRF